MKPVEERIIPELLILHTVHSVDIKILEIIQRDIITYVFFRAIQTSSFCHWTSYVERTSYFANKR